MTFLKSNTLLSVVSLFVCTSAFAWEKHQLLMPWVVKTLPESEKTALEIQLKTPEKKAQKIIYEELVQKLALNSAARVLSPLSLGVTLRSLLLAETVDEPDFGMDQELPESADPLGERKFMGGTTGTTSQGFRHMYFGGWQLAHPVTTFQIPTKAIGQSPTRVEKIMQASLELKKRSETAWSLRVLGWAMHYVQDLAQPFHSVQMPHLAMVPWGALLQWPPQKGFAALVHETTRTISNYHFAFEGYTKLRVSEGDVGPFSICIVENVKAIREQESKPLTPIEIAHHVAERSIELGPEIGRGNMTLFGRELLEKSHNLPLHQGEPDYAALASRAEFAERRQALEKPTCKALANAVWASQALLTFWGKN